MGTTPHTAPVPHLLQAARTQRWLGHFNTERLVMISGKMQRSDSFKPGRGRKKELLENKEMIMNELLI